MRTKIKELLALNEVEPVYDFSERGTDNPNTLENIMKRQDALLNEIKELSKKHNTILGREVRFPMGDGYAHYIITKINKLSVQLTCIRYCDAWQDSRIGYSGNIDIDWVTKHVNGRDNMEKLFGAKK